MTQKVQNGIPIFLMIPFHVNTIPDEEEWVVRSQDFVCVKVSQFVQFQAMHIYITLWWLFREENSLQKIDGGEGNNCPIPQTYLLE